MASERAQSLIVFGPTQSHKTSGLAVPAILGWEGPVIAASVKTDLIEHTIAHRRAMGSVRASILPARPVWSRTVVAPACVPDLAGCPQGRSRISLTWPRRRSAP